MHPKLRYGTHLPVLIKVVSMTDGPILELGGGMYSTPFLHWACFEKKRRLVTYENDPQFYDAFKQWHSDWHSVILVDDWDNTDLSCEWSVALVDHRPGPQRGKDMRRLTHAEYVIAHDSQDRNAHKYGYQDVVGLFKYAYRYRKAYPHTSIFSNQHDVSGIMA